MRVPLVLLGLLLLAPFAPAAAPHAPMVSRDAFPVILLGADLPALSVVPRYVERPPMPFAEEERDGAWLPLPAVEGHERGADVAQLYALAWSGAALREIPLQVDERFVRYLTNYQSGFGVYSQSDMHVSYAFDVEGTKKEGERADAPHVADFTVAGDVTTPDPVAGLDHDDELVMLYGDLGPRAPAPPTGMHEISARDALTGETRYAYVGVRLEGNLPATGVAYARDADADLYVQSNHGGYGGAPGGACFQGDGVDAPWGTPAPGCDHRRPKDSATVTTERYQFHYAGRWKLDGLVVGGVDLVDRWKGRAFQQREGNALDVGGFEDENDWTRSSVTLGEKAGPVRVLRETWGADSGTSVTRLDVFYPELVQQVYRMRVHPVPPDGVYAFWDHASGAVDTYFTPLRPEGVPIDGANDELAGTNSEWQDLFTVDTPDPTLSGALANVAWDQASGRAGSLVTFIRAPDTRSGVLTPYYRDDAAFEDGTGEERGSFGAHGIHFFVTSDTDNAFTPAPVTEFVAEVHQLVLEGRAPYVGDDFAALQLSPLVVSGPAARDHSFA